MAPASATVKTVKVWFNAFIPKEVVGLTHIVSKGPHAGKTFVYGPPLPFKRGAFLTNNRTFDTSDTRSPTHSKMHTDLLVDFSKSPPTLTTTHVGGESIEIDPVSGAVRRTAVGSTARMVAWPILPALLGVPLPSVRIPIKLSAAIPLIFGAGMIADMDVIGFLTIDPVKRTVVFDGKVDEFPAYEAYVSADGGPPKLLFRQPILDRKGPGDLIFMPTLSPKPGEVTF